MRARQAAPAGAVVPAATTTPAPPSQGQHPASSCNTTQQQALGQQPACSSGCAAELAAGDKKGQPAVRVYLLAQQPGTALHKQPGTALRVQYGAHNQARAQPHNLNGHTAHAAPKASRSQAYTLPLVALLALLSASPTSGIPSPQFPTYWSASVKRAELSTSTCALRHGFCDGSSRLRSWPPVAGGSKAASP